VPCWHNLDPQGWLRDPAAHTFRSFIVPQFVSHYLRHKYLLEEGSQNVDLLDQNQIIQRAGVGDNEPHRWSEPETLKVIPVLLDVVERIRGVDIMGLEEPVQGLSRLESE
jgi:hypothetical protein